MANTANTVLVTNFNVTPYYDDYDSSKGYYRILFKPGYSIQAREMTQMQTMLQEQVTRFGRHVFREGSVVLPGEFTVETNNGGPIGQAIPFVKIKDLDNNNNAVSVRNLKGATLVGGTTGIRAKVIEVLDGRQTDPNTKTLYIRYLSAAGTTKVFQPDEVLRSTQGNCVAMSGVPTGFGSRFEISDGVIFAKNHFIAFPKTSIIIERYNPNPTRKVGFLLTEQLVNANDDASLLDPALESSNYSAPGADRFAINTELITYTFESVVDQRNYVPLLELRNGVVSQSFERTTYNIIADELAKRTYDESGDYVVRGMQVQLKEHNDTGFNYGRYPNGNTQLLAVSVSSGTAYLQGYEIDIQNSIDLTTRKGLDTGVVRSQTSSAAMGSFFTCDEFVGSWELNKGITVYFGDTAQNRISTKKFAAGAQTGNLIGVAKLLSVEYNTGSIGKPDCQYNVYLTDIQMNPGYSPSQIKSIWRQNSPNPDLGCDIVLRNGIAVLQSIPDPALVFYVGSKAVKAIRDADNQNISATSFTYLKTDGISSTVEIATNGQFTVTIPVGTEKMAFGSGSLGNADKREIILTVVEGTSISQTGTVNGTVGSTTLVGSAGVNFFKFNPGDRISITGQTDPVIIESITDATHLTVTSALPAGLSGNTFAKVYRVGDIIDLNGVGVAAGETRTVTSTDTTLAFDIKETFASPVSVNVTYPVTRSTALEVPKVIKRNRYVKINAASLTSTQRGGAINLGFSDVFRIVSIRKLSGSYPTSTTGSDVTSQFIFNNGQRDNFYDHATITPITPLDAGDRLLVCLDYFDHNYSTTAGYFSVNSYPIQDNTAIATSANIRTEEVPQFVSPTNRSVYDLRNYLDFRPVKVSIAADAVDAGTATENPGLAGNIYYPFTTTGFKSGATGLKFPQPSSQITYDYQYYKGRIDLLVADREKNFAIIEGTPADVPTSPKVPQGKAALATLEIRPYPSLSPAYANKLGKGYLGCKASNIAVNRFTMRDIGVLRDRIVNLEYYNSLNALEKASANYTIRDQDGLERFKNGLFVDSFNDSTLSSNPGQWCVDSNEKSMRPIFTMESIGYDYISGTNVVKKSDLVMLPYSDIVYWEQEYATSYRNIERTSYMFMGTLDLTPNQDVWVDTVYLPDEILKVENYSSSPPPPITPGYNNNYQVLNTEWGAWHRYAIGFNLKVGNTIIGTAKTYEEARSKAYAWSQCQDVTLEINYNNVRVGTQTRYWEQTNTQSTGYSVRDVSVIPYIRPQVIYVKGSSLKPNSRMYVYFDNVPVSNMCTPLSSNAYIILASQKGEPNPYVINPNVAVTVTSSAVVTQITPGAGVGNMGDPINADIYGNIYFAFKVPQGRFRTGERALVVADTNVNIAEEELAGGDITGSITTGARGIFYADGQHVEKRRTILSTRAIYQWDVGVTESYASQGRETYGRRVPPWSHSCAAYSFLVQAPNNEEGIFLTAADIFVAQKSPSPERGMWFEIREMDSGGSITRNQVPYSRVDLTNAQLNISPDGRTNPTKVTFPAPVFLYHNTQYAFILHSINADPDTYVWTSKLGEKDVATQYPRTSRPFQGTYYSTNNNLNWDIVPDVDLTVKFYRAEFTPNSVGNAILANKKFEKFVTYNVSKDLTADLGDVFVTNDRLSITGANGTITVGDRIVGVTSGAASLVEAIGDRVYMNTNVNYIPGERFNVLFAANNVYKKISGTISNVTNGYGFLTYFKDFGSFYVTHVEQSNGDYRAGEILRSASDPAAYFYISNAVSMRYSAVSFEPEYVKFNTTGIAFQMATTSNTGIASAFVTVEPSETYYFNSEQAILSRAAAAAANITHSNRVLINMSTSSNAVSPIIDIGRTHTVFLDNIISNDAANETRPAGGNMLNKYISKTVTLAEGQDAEDLRVILTAYRPPGTDVLVWAKVLHREDSSPFDERPWIPMKVLTGGENYSSLADRDDFREYQFNFDDSYMTGTTLEGAFSYTDNNGVKFEGFKRFAIKVGLVLASGNQNTAIVPRAADLRVIALQM